MVRLRRKIVLIGLMGVGKTSVGKRLAELLRVPFTDSDDEIAEAAGMSIPEIFEKYGEGEFRALERRVLSRVMEGDMGVVSTGGGAFCQPEIRKDIAASGVSVWLDADLETLWRRVQDKPGRPLLSVEDPKARLAALMEERQPIYAGADLRVQTSGSEDQTAVAKNVIRSLIVLGREDPSRTVIEQEVET